MGFTDPEFSLDDEALIRGALRGLDVDDLRQRGVVRLDLAEDLLPFVDGGFATPTGKAEFLSPQLADLGLDPLPTYHPPRESAAGDPDLVARFPLSLLTPKSHTRFLNTSYSHLPKHGPPEGGPFVELDPTDAGARGIGDGDIVEVWNDRARLRLPARISERVRPGVVAVPFGWQQKDHGQAATANSLTNDTLTEWGGGVAYSDTLVEVAKSALL
jgi:anaerobic selenocysteine-containing dehydrogenase